MKELCKWPGCNRLIPIDDGYCALHMQVIQAKSKKRRNEQAKKYREKTGPRVYNKQQWKRLRKMKLAENPFCERCGVLAVLVHHKDRDKDNWSWNNFESLCKSCHVEEHRQRK